MSRFLAMLLIFITLTGCVMNDPSMPGHLSERKAVFDNAREVYMKPAWTKDSGGLKLGLFWRSPMKNEILVIAEITGLHNFSPNDTLDFKVDGKLMKLKPANAHDLGDIKTDDFGTAGIIQQSQKAFIANKQQLKSLLSGKTVLVRVEMLRGYAEGRFSLNANETGVWYGEMIAYNGFKNTYAKIWP